MPQQNKTEYDLHTVMAVCARMRRPIRRTRVRRIDTMQIRKYVTILFVVLISIVILGLAREFMF
ncbi:MAG: hypothetical protein IJU61_00020 [Victivallales bacterium]|jgi:hypothetical protein|nr:hypothetical protein [Victivallales bacterium]